MPKSKTTNKKSNGGSSGRKKITPEVLGDDQICRLLTDVEKLNLPRSKIALKDVMNKDLRYYMPRTSLSRAFQKKWDLILRRSADSYVKYLFNHNVEPSQATQKELENEEKKDDKSFSSVEEQEDSTLSSDSEEEDEADEDTPFDIHEIGAGISAMSLTSPVKQKKMMKSPTPKKTAAPRGSKSNPHVIHVDTDRPECNGPLLVQLVHKQKINDFYAAHAFTFIGTMAVPDYPLWKIHQISKHAVLLEKPSLEFWQRQCDMYLSSCDCDSTVKTFGETKQAIVSAGEDRTTEYFRYEFSAMFPLDVHALSDPKREDEAEVTKNPYPLSYQPPGITKKVQGLVAIWSIAVRGTKTKYSETALPTENLDALFPTTP